MSKKINEFVIKESLELDELYTSIYTSIDMIGKISSTAVINISL